MMFDKSRIEKSYRMILRYFFIIEECNKIHIIACLCKIDATEHSITHIHKKETRKLNARFMDCSKCRRGKTDISKGTNPLIAERNHKNQEIRADIV